MQRKDKGLSGGHGFGRRSGPLAIPSVSLQALEGCGGERHCGAASEPGPCGPSQALGGWSKAVGVLWNLARGASDMPEHLSRVYNGIFWLMQRSASSAA